MRVHWPDIHWNHGPLLKEHLRTPISVRLPRGWVVGDGHHRSGWPFAVRSLQPLCSPDGIFFEDFVERNFLYRRGTREGPHVYRKPWIGVFHHSYSAPLSIAGRDRVQEILQSPQFRESQQHLIAGVALTDRLARFLAEFLQIPVVSLKHPTETPRLRFSPQAFLENDNRMLLQVGYYLRNTQLAFQVPPNPNFRRARLKCSLEWVGYYDRRVQRFWEIRGGRKTYSGVEEVPRACTAKYDALLSKNIVISEMFDASANNVVLECIVRHTPLIVNPHPAVVEYLGPAYPLYFEHVEQIPALLTFSRILCAHEYLAGMDKSQFSGRTFCNSLRAGLEQLTK